MVSNTNVTLNMKFCVLKKLKITEKVSRLKDTRYNKHQIHSTAKLRCSCLDSVMTEKITAGQTAGTSVLKNQE